MYTLQRSQARSSCPAADKGTQQLRQILLAGYFYWEYRSIAKRKKVDRYGGNYCDCP